MSYVVFSTNNTLPVIIVVDLMDELVNELIAMHKQFKKAIRWTIVDIIFIQFGVCIHKIQLVKDWLSIKYQWYLHPSMQEVGCKEIIKWLDASVTYADIEWVSLVQCVPKKGDITMI